MQVLALDYQSGFVLVPVSMVAQIVSRLSTKEYSSDLNFLSTSVNWREMDIPLVNSSELLGAETGADSAAQRAIVLWPMKGCKPTDLFALTSIGSPQVVSITADNKRLSPDSGAIKSESAKMFAMDCLDIDGKPGVIPDLKLLSTLIFPQ